MQEIEHLVKMANQIAENFSFHDDAVERITDHLQKFWAPSMLEKLFSMIGRNDNQTFRAKSFVPRTQ